jgi:hypothetical protein
MKTSASPFLACFFLFYQTPNSNHRQLEEYREAGDSDESVEIDDYHQVRI